MRELNAGAHKLRRPSFSNTLSELPEVEEPEQEYGGVAFCHMTGGSSATTTPFNVLPPINNNEDMSPSPRPRFNTIPEGVTERPKSLSRTTVTISSPKQRHSYPGRTSSILQTLDKELSGPHKPKMSKRKKSCGSSHQRAGLNSDKLVHDGSRRPSLTAVAPVQKSKEVVSPSSHNRNESTSSDNIKNVIDITSTEPNNSVDNDVKTETPHEKDTWNKDIEVIKWRKALDRAKNESPSGSFENLLTEDAYNRSKRRFSMPLDNSWDRRLSNPAFADTSRKVDILMKYGKAVRNKYRNSIRSGNKFVPSKAIRTLADFVIELPKKPRFSTYMSPQAQYALMKGYEDKLYRKLSNSLPEYNPLLKRNKTPKNTSIDIKSRNTLGFLNDSGNDNEDSNSSDDEKNSEKNGDNDRETKTNKTTISFLTELDDSGSNVHSSLSTAKTDTVHNNVELQNNDAKVILRNIRRLSISLDKNSRASINKSFHGEYDDTEEEDICSTLTTARQRSHSMPSVSSVPFQRRLMMSYRLQSAMDILDNIQSGNEATLSPRLTSNKKGATLAEYNAWVADWNKEFCLKH